MSSPDTLVADEFEAAANAGPGDSDRVRPGERWDRFEILEHLGSGGMGRVFSAHDCELDRVVALKVLSSQRRRGATPDQRLLREAQAMAQLSHPNVVEVLGVHHLGGVLAISMELIRGQTLAAWAKTPRRWEESLPVVVAAAHGLDAAHRAGLVHRDFKPENVMLGDDGRVRVLDFGLAKPAPTTGVPIALATLDDSGPIAQALTNLTRTGAQLGTPAYMAPEQHLQHELGPHTDQFAWAIVAWELLYGEHPFGSATTAATLAVQVTGGRLDAPAAGRRVPRWLGRALRRALAPEPGHRFANMAALIRAVDPGRHARRRLRWGVAVVGAATAVLGAAALPEFEPTDPCADLGTEVGEVWTDARKRSIATAFGAAGPVYATQTWPTVRDAIDRKTRGWRDEAVASCRAASGVAAPARVCLERRLQALDAVLDVMNDADTTVVNNALSAVGGLDKRSCDDASSPSPSEPSTEAQAIQSQLDRVSALVSAGRYEAAMTPALSALERAKATGDIGLVARLQLELGILYSNLRDLSESESMLREAYFSAVGAKWRYGAALAASELVGATGRGGARHDEALSWARHAESQIAGDAALAHLEVRRVRRLAFAEDQAGRVEQALGYFEAASEMLEDLPPGHDGLAGDVHSGWATTLEGAGRLAQARVAAHRAIEAYQQAHPPDHPRFAPSYDVLGTIARHEHRYDDAIRHHTHAIQLRTAAHGPDHFDVGALTHNLGHVFMEAGRADEALEHFTRAREVIEASAGADHPSLALAIYSTGAALGDLGRRDEAIELTIEALEIWQRTLPEDHPKIAGSLSRLGNLYRDDSQLDLALEYGTRAVAINRRSLPADHPHLPLTLYNLGLTHLARGDMVHAREDFESAIVLIGDRTDIPVLPKVRFALARALWADETRRPEAVRLARQVLDQTEIDEDGDAMRRDVRAWLRTRPG